MTDRSPAASEGEARRSMLYTRREFVDAAHTVLGMAKRRICIFDPDLTLLELSGSQSTATLNDFLSAHRDNRIEIVVHREQDLLATWPRLETLLRGYPDRISVHRTLGEARAAQDSMIIVDERHFVRRPVAEQDRAVLVLDDAADSRAIVERFQEIRALSEVAMSSTTLGL